MGEQVVHAYETVNLLADGPAATIELNRPDTLNAWNRQFAEDLLAAIQKVSGDPGVRSVVIRGAGRGFSSGADLRDIAADSLTPAGRPDVQKILVGRYHPIIEGIRRMRKPVIAAVHGPAVGIGLSLALACDLVVASETAYFLLAFINIGLVPDGGASVFVPARIGFARAVEMAMLGERVPAGRALDWGLINQVHPDGEFTAAVAELAGRLAAGPTAAYAAVKRQSNNWLEAAFPGQLAVEAAIQQEMAATDDFAEGLAAFAERRPAHFAGS
ncbi:MAG TPA: enoyl-CoA hydratase-related protein [Solirubrobacteraceae bacterium]